MEHLRTATMKRTIIFTILLLLCSCGDKSSEDKSEQCGIGKYVYVDWYNTIHIDRECAARSGDNLKTMTERMASRHGVQFVDTCDLTSRGKSGEKHGFCPRCIDDKAYRHLSDIIDGNRHIENRRKLYDTLMADGAPLPDYDTFEKFMSKPANRREFYDKFKADGAPLPDFETFERDLAPKQPVNRNMPDIKRRKLYDALVADNYDMGSYEQFCKDITDAGKRRKLYDAMVKDGYDMEPFDEFEANIGYRTKAMKLWN